MITMEKPYNFSTASTDLYHLLIEVEKYKSFVKSQDNPESSLLSKDIIVGNSLNTFGAEIFQFWLAALKFKDVDKKDFLTFADSVRIPVRNRDLGVDELSWFGHAIFSVWKEAIISKTKL